MKHTEGPWLISKPRHPGKDQENDRLIHTKDGRHVAETFQYQNHSSPSGPSIPNAQRIVACVNACEGINPEAVPDLLEALTRLVERINHNTDPLHTLPPALYNKYINQARAAIAKATD